MDYIISSGELEFCLAKENIGVALKYIKDINYGNMILNEGCYSLFTATLQNVRSGEILKIDSLNNWENTEVINNGGVWSILFSGNDSVKEISVLLQANCITKNSSVQWRASMQNASSDYSITELDYPMLSVSTDENTSLLYPYGCGEVFENIKEKKISYNENYPSYGVSMQLFSVWNEESERGMYYGIHDGDGYYKKFKAEKPENSDILTLKASFPAENMTKAGNSVTLSGTAVWQIFSGDWYEASLIYKEFIINNARWIPEIDENGRKDIPEWLLKTPHWWLVHMDDSDSFVSETLKAQEDLGIPSAVHLYLWHEIPFDNDYPHYFPERKSFLDNFKRLQEKGMKVMPYINGRLWDTRDKEDTDFLFTKQAKASATKNEKGEVYTESYSSQEKDGSRVSLAVMCPSTAVWQNKQTEIVDKLFNQVGVDAVYIDQIAAASPKLCCDQSHYHPTGGGRWWVDGYYNMLEHIEKITPKNKACTTECTAEPFMNMGAFLSWMWVRNRQVPAFSSIYASYIPLIGRAYTSAIEPEAFRLFAAQSLLYGEQMGWLSPQKYFSIKQKEKDFYKTCVKLRYKFNEFFYAGSMLKPPKAESNVSDIKCTECKMASNGLIESKAILTGMWERFSDKSRLLIISNISETEADISLITDINIQNAQTDILEYTQNLKTLNFKMPPLSVKYILSN